MKDWSDKYVEQAKAPKPLVSEYESLCNTCRYGNGYNPKEHAVSIKDTTGAVVDYTAPVGTLCTKIGGFVDAVECSEYERQD